MHRAAVPSLADMHRKDGDRPCQFAGISARLTTHLKSVLNAAARMIIGLRRRDHISQTLADLHWLRAAERINFKLAVTVCRCSRNTAPGYLSRDICRISDLASRSRLRSSSSHAIPRCRLSTVGERTFAVAATRVWKMMMLQGLQRLRLRPFFVNG